jgi:hypothetical protein
MELHNHPLLPHREISNQRPQSGPMQLRHHPLMSYCSMHNWPLIWIEKYGDNKILSGEIGVLKHIGTNPALGNRSRSPIASIDRSRAWIDEQG